MVSTVTLPGNRSRSWSAASMAWRSTGFITRGTPSLLMAFVTGSSVMWLKWSG